MKKILFLITFALFLLKPSYVFAQSCEVYTGDCATSGRVYECPTLKGNYCCATQNDCHNLQTTEGTDKPIGTPTPTPTRSPIPAFLRGACMTNSIDTAIGCIPIGSTTDFVGWILGWFIGIAGGIAFLMIVWSAFKIITSSGNPEQVQSSRELLTAAISGLILIIFSIFLLRLIGVEILQLPGFNK